MGWQSGHICAGLSQEKRIHVMNSMREFKMRVLVCSDLVIYMMSFFHSFMIIIYIYILFIIYYFLDC